jgi:methylated-DNA-protein-cysteine methyltransferase-like protein
MEEKVMEEKSKNFFEDVYEVVRLVPPGRVTSYGAIAEFLGAKRSARMVGWALISAHSLADNVPTHRVVNRNGLLTGRHHFETPTRMQERLEQEGVKVENEQVVGFKNLFWNPSVELL